MNELPEEITLHTREYIIELRNTKPARYCQFVTGIIFPDDPIFPIPNFLEDANADFSVLVKIRNSFIKDLGELFQAELNRVWDTKWDQQDVERIRWWNNMAYYYEIGDFSNAGVLAMLKRRGRLIKPNLSPEKRHELKDRLGKRAENSRIHKDKDAVVLPATGANIGGGQFEGAKHK